MEELKELNGVKYMFRTISTETGLKAKNLLMKLANDPENEAADRALIELSIKNLTVYLVDEMGGEKRLDNPSLEQVGNIFKNTLAVLEIQQEFARLIEGFIKSLPSYQNFQK